MEGLAHSMEELSSEDFPLFLTVKRLILMLDASTNYPFFARDKTGKQIGLESNVEWHNEQGGVFMINQYHKNQTNYDGVLSQLSQKLVELHDHVEAVEIQPDEADHADEAQTERNLKGGSQQDGASLMGLM